MESLFNMTLDMTPCSHELKEVELRSKTYGFLLCMYLFSSSQYLSNSDISEGTVQLKLTIVETAGFGDHFDKDTR